MTSKLRRTLVAWAALAGLLAAPVAETLHEFQHLAPVRSDSQSKGVGGVKPACETCAAYSAMGHALWNPPLLLLPDQGAPQRVVLRERGRTVAPAYAYQERAPPPSSPNA